MSDRHIIRLAGPWARHQPDDSSRSQRITLPDAHDRPAVYRRNFNIPFDLATHRVFLVIEGLTSAVPVQINDQAVGAIEPDSDLEITASLGPFNRLTLPCPAGLKGPVTLQIHDLTI